MAELHRLWPDRRHPRWIMRRLTTGSSASRWATPTSTAALPARLCSGSPSAAGSSPSWARAPRPVARTTWPSSARGPRAAAPLRRGYLPAGGGPAACLRRAGLRRRIPRGCGARQNSTNWLGSRSSAASTTAQAWSARPTSSATVRCSPRYRCALPGRRASRRLPPRPCRHPYRLPSALQRHPGKGRGAAWAGL